MPYNSNDKKQKLARAYGTHTIHSGNGKMIEYLAEANGSGLTLKARLALGEAKFHEIEKMAYDGIDIDSANYELFKESGDVDPADTLFPTSQLNAGASFVDFTLPPGMAEEGTPEKAVVRAKCLEIADFDDEGEEIDNGFSDDAARVAADGIIHLTGNPNVIEWASWYDFKQFTSENITVEIDEEEEELPRFPLNFFLIPQFDLNHFLDRVCQLTCSDWTWAHNKIRFLPPIDRSSSFPFNSGNLARVFQFSTTQLKSRINGVRVSWRDLNHPFLIEADPIVIDRRENENIPENFYEINAGVCRKDVAERIGNYWAKVKCDLTDFAFLRSSFPAYPVLPGDVVSVSHPTPNWTNKRCKVLRKTEKEDRTTTSGEERFQGYGVYVQLEPENPYSDADFTPLETRTYPEGVNRFAAPPLADLTLTDEILNPNDATKVTSVLGLVEFGDFGFPQFAKVFWKKPSGTYEHLKDIKPDAENKAEFRAVNLSAGTHYFKVQTFSDLLITDTDSTEESIVISSTTFLVDGQSVPDSVNRTFTGFDANGKYTGRDTAKVPTARIIPAIERNEELTGDFVAVKIVGSVTGFEADQAAQADSLISSRVTVFDNFGTSLKTLSKTFKGTGDLGEGTVDFDGDASDLYFKIELLNYHGWSDAVYLLSNGTYSTTAPTPDTPPSDLPPLIVSISYNPATQQVTVNWTPRGGSGTFKLQKSSTEGGSYTDVSGQTAIGSGSTSTSFTVAQTSSTQQIWYKISRADVGAPDYSAADDVIIPALDPAQSPNDLTVIQITAATPFDISWNERGAAGDNVLEYSPDNFNWYVVSSSASTPTTHDPTFGGDYFYRISNTAIPGVYDYSGRVRWLASEV